MGHKKSKDNSNMFISILILSFLAGRDSSSVYTMGCASVCMCVCGDVLRLNGSSWFLVVFIVGLDLPMAWETFPGGGVLDLVFAWPLLLYCFTCRFAF